MSRLRRIVEHTLWALFSLLLTVVFITVVMYTYMELQLPDVEMLKDVHMQVPLRVYTLDRKLIAQYGAKRRIPVMLDQVPKQLIRAVLATEDARYYKHQGVDLIGIIRAAKVVITSGKKTQGASTITMQVARNFFLTRKKTYSRKINEILLALKIDKELSKQKVLELYLNKIYLGNRAYGVAAAAKIYYGKMLNQLTLPEMAMIAGLPQAPSRNNPIDNPQAAIQRRNHVLKRMYEVGFISKQHYEQAILTPITAKYHAQKIQVKAPYVAEMVREAMVEEYGKNAYDKGLSVYTTLQSKLQKAANASLHDGLLAYDERHGYRKPTENLGPFDQQTFITALKHKEIIDNLYPAVVVTVGDAQVKALQALMANGNIITIPWSQLSWARPELENGYLGAVPKEPADIVKVGDVIRVMQRKNNQWHLAQIPQVQGAIVVLNPQDGALLALSGGFNYNRSNFNRAIQAERQPGSNFKPFIYSAALAKGYTLATLINDAPVVVKDTGENRLWHPVNDNLKFYGPTSLRMGLIKSRNLVSIRLLQAIGIPYALNYVKLFGFDPNTLPNTLSLALGSGTVTPMQIANGYAVFANGGYRVNPYFIQRINDQHDQELYHAEPVKACLACITNPNTPTDQIPQPAAPRVITPQNAYLITQALRGVIKLGTGRAARVLKRPDLAGKTGTTNKQVDAWFSGFNNNIVASVWVGFDNLKPLKEYAAKAALPIWIQFMRDALKGTAEATMPQPPGMVTVRIDPHTGLLANPNSHDAKFEVFRKEYAPHDMVPIDSSRASTPNGGNTNTRSEISDEHLF